jgi:hypothetical protein
MVIPPLITSLSSPKWNGKLNCFHRHPYDIFFQIYPWNDARKKLKPKY